ncbi:integrin beta pat-3-like [Dermacentor silvarum]|uniref:integrin beta pat-3-like n=1 Tax=Dermacentor silvarum TaxID=543639 RepID=UPI0021007085|nr:integrin beta pat-3-like [Dermacentor silvarum]
MKCFPAFVHLYLSINLVFPDIVYGDQHASCIRCFCKTGKSTCELENDKCTCINERMYLKNSTRCVVHTEDCGLHPVGKRIRPGCLPCQCSRGSDQCDLIDSNCTCRDGSIYFMESDNQCVLDIDECSTHSPTRSNCARCTCPHGQRKCYHPGNQCECINGRYYMPDSDECVQNDEDCISPSPFSNCAKCICPPGQRKCHLVGNKCDCINGKYYMNGSNECVENEDDCIFDNPPGTCAKCFCPRGERKCHFFGNKCDCINEKYYMPGSHECVKNDEHCIIPRPTRNCARCTCPPGELQCHLIGNKCDCVNGNYYLTGSDKCVENEGDCISDKPTR